MTLSIPFDNSYARLPQGFSHRQSPDPVSAPSLIAWNSALAQDLGVSGEDDPQLASYFAGNQVPDGAEPLAQLYAGHQFGQYNPQLGDGRALLLGEVVDIHGQRRDIQLKGSGQTPFSRRGDGRAWLGPVLREYVVSEAMHALGVPTTRALAATRTGDTVYREQPLPGAVLTRVASSHIRVGTFQVFSARQDWDALRTLFNYTVDRHFPQVSTPVELLQEVIRRQISLVGHWLSLGFVHGVMNTDNCTLSGETIDYGPCAFLEAYQPDTVFSSIDRRGRYAYAAQADVIAWNMAQLATALVPLEKDSDKAIASFTTAIHAQEGMMRAQWLQRFGAKLGLSDPQEDDIALIGDLLVMMDRHGADFTNTFRALTDGQTQGLFPDSSGFDAWEHRWKTRLEREDDPTALMQRSNPVYIPRNHRVEELIQAAVQGDDAPFHRLCRVLENPYQHQNGAEDLRAPATRDQEVKATFCGT
jgi:uncharacterized protein YdiU (UPF0061 family)